MPWNQFQSTNGQLLQMLGILQKSENDNGNTAGPSRMDFFRHVATAILRENTILYQSTFILEVGAQKHILGLSRSLSTCGDSNMVSPLRLFTTRKRCLETGA
jgi:hypothetical protein